MLAGLRRLRRRLLSLPRAHQPGHAALPTRPKSPAAAAHRAPNVTTSRCARFGLALDGGRPRRHRGTSALVSVEQHDSAADQRRASSHRRRRRWSRTRRTSSRSRRRSSAPARPSRRPGRAAADPGPASRCCPREARCCWAPTSRAVLTTLAALDVQVIGLNCSEPGPEDMRDAIRYLGENSPAARALHPQRGPAPAGPRRRDDLPRAARAARRRPGRVRRAPRPSAIVGGCCGTTPEHIAAIRQSALTGRVPEGAPRTPRPPQVSSMDDLHPPLGAGAASRRWSASVATSRPRSPGTCATRAARSRAPTSTRYRVIRRRPVAATFRGHGSSRTRRRPPGECSSATGCGCSIASASQLLGRRDEIARLVEVMREQTRARGGRFARRPLSRRARRAAACRTPRSQTALALWRRGAARRASSLLRREGRRTSP